MAILRAGLLALHVAGISLAASGTLVATALQLYGGRRRRYGEDEALAQLVGGKVAGWGLAGFAVGSLAGAALVGLAWLNDTEYWNVLQRLPARAYWTMLSELVFSAMLMGLQYVRWNRWWRRPARSTVAALLASSNLLYHFPPFMIALRDMASHPEQIPDDVLSRPVLLTYMGQGMIVSLAIHFGVASLLLSAVTSLWLTVANDASATEQDHADKGEEIDEFSSSAQHLVARISLWVLALALMQLPLGGWAFFQLSKDRWLELTGGSIASSVLFAASLLAYFRLLQELGAIALGAPTRTSVRAATGLTVLTVLGMALTASQ